MCVCVCERERERERERDCVYGKTGHDLKYGDRGGFTEKVTFRQIHENVAKHVDPQGKSSPGRGKAGVKA